jgi:TldD protein
VLIIAAKDGVMETAYKAVSGRKGYELLREERIMDYVKNAAELSVRLLSTDKKIAGKMPAIISSEAGGTLIHEAVGHSLEADLVQKGVSPYKKERLGEKVASDIVTVVDDATILNKRGSFSFDDEGIQSQKKILVEKGILRNYMYDRLTALKDLAMPTGNGRRESYKFKPIPRMTNTMIAPGTGPAKDLIKDTKYGIFVKKMGGGQVNTVTGDFIFEVGEAYMIENGEVGEPLRGATLMGNGPHVLNTIDAVCNDLGFEVGTCGKDGQGVPVSDAQPTIRIPEILVGSK